MAGDTNWTEYYLTKGYIRRDDTDIYAVDSFHNQKIFVNDENEQVYARTTEASELVEYPPKNSKGESIYIVDEHQRVRYPRNLKTGKPILDLDYPVDQNQNPVYDYDFADQPIFYQRYGITYYGKNAEGTEVYPKDKNGIEIYRKEQNREIPARNKDGLYYYAKNKDLDEYYPKAFRDLADQVPFVRDAYDIDDDTYIVLVK